MFFREYIEHLKNLINHLCKRGCGKLVQMYRSLFPFCPSARVLVSPRGDDPHLCSVLAWQSPGSDRRAVMGMTFLSHPFPMDLGSAQAIYLVWHEDLKGTFKLYSWFRPTANAPLSKHATEYQVAAAKNTPWQAQSLMNVGREQPHLGRSEAKMGGKWSKTRCLCPFGPPKNFREAACVCFMGKPRQKTASCAVSKVLARILQFVNRLIWKC